MTPPRGSHADSRRPRPLTRQEASDRSALVSHVTYDVALDVTDDADHFGCRTTVRFHGRPGTQTFLDFCPAATPTLIFNGADLTPERFDGDRIHVALEERNELIVVAEGAYNHEGVGLHRFVDPIDGEVYLHTKFEPFDAHRVFPCFDQPDVKASLTLSVSGPGHWSVVANSPAAATAVDSGRGLWQFRPTEPLPTYLFALVAGPFRQLKASDDRHDLGLWSRPSHSDALRADADELFEVTARGLDWFEARFGIPLPFAKYDQCFVPEFGFGAMEHPGCVTFNERFVFRSKVTADTRRRRTEVILHEMAHMWFGDLVTMRWWDDLWLNESFATLLATQVQAAVTGDSGRWVAFANDVATARRADELPTAHPVTAEVSDTDAARLNFDPITYRKGAAVLQQLSVLLGEDAWEHGLRDYLRRFAWTNADSTDVLGVLQEHSPFALDGWAAHWLRTAGCNTLSARETPEGLEVHQTATDDQPVLRRHRTQIGLYADDGTSLIPLACLDAVLSEACTTLAGSHSQSSSSGSRPDLDLVLVNDGGLTYAKAQLDERSVETLLRRLSSLPEAMSRAVAWGALWDAVLDAQLPGRRFIDCVAEHSLIEADVGVLQRLWEQAIQAATVYGDPANRACALGVLSKRASVELDAAQPASDRQLAWTRQLAATARTATELVTLRDLLDARGRPGGLDVDRDLRWTILTCLAAQGSVDEDHLAEAFAADTGDEARRHYLTAQAARPDAAVKAEAWNRASEGGGSLAERRALMSGWRQPGQEPWLEPFVVQYFDSIAEIWDSHGPDAGSAFARGMYPHVSLDPAAVLALSDAVVSTHALPAGLVRVLIEERARLAWAVAARACDMRGRGLHERRGTP